MAKSEKEIIRAVSLNGEVYLPGQEDELEQAFKDHAAAQRDADQPYDHKKNIERLTKQGAIVGFGSELDDEDIDEPDLDRGATRRSGNSHLLEQAEPLQRGSAPPPTMEDIQRQPDRNVVEMHAVGGAEKHQKAGQEELAGSDQKARGLEKAQDQLDEAHIQQESAQVPSPDAGAGSGVEARTKAAKGSGRKTAAKESE